MQNHVLAIARMSASSSVRRSQVTR